ncbi:MAG: hypothetical protein JSS66_17525 [Armatimonadetes bacterium]|nr:hypothetical protein [Armatimonadota bacterium]
MLRECIERCPDDLWTASNPESPASHRDDNPEWNGVERPFWRIAFHDIYFTHLYLGRSASAFEAPPSSFAVSIRADFAPMWCPPWSLEPYELPSETPPCLRPELLEYLDYVDSLVDPTVDALDLESPSSGFEWYPQETKLSHVLLNLRHLQGHVGQLSELLMLQGIDVSWQ